MSAAATIPTDHLAGELLAAELGRIHEFPQYDEPVRRRYRNLARAALEVMAKAETEIVSNPIEHMIQVQPLEFEELDHDTFVAQSPFGTYTLSRTMVGWNVVADFAGTISAHSIADFDTAKLLAFNDLFVRIMQSLQFGDEPKADERTCKICGCTDSRACVDEDGPCHWPAPGVDVCSSCANKLNSISDEPQQEPAQIERAARDFAEAYATSHAETVIEKAVKLYNHVVLATQQADGFHSTALADVIAERRRQVQEEGWTAEHDDQHEKCELAKAAVAYAYFATRGDDVREHYNDGALDVRNMVVWKRVWPWSQDWWKPKTQRFDLIRAAALILAEIERIDRKYDAEQWAPEPDTDLAGDDCGDEDREAPRSQFGHDPDPAIDAQIEVKRLTGCLHIARAGLERVLEFRDLTANAISIKATARRSLDHSNPERVL